MLGAILVPVGFEEVTRFIPTSNSLPPNLIPSLEWVAIGLLIVVFLWVRPQGVLPERKRVITLPQAAGRRRPRPGGPGRHRLTLVRAGRGHGRRGDRAGNRGLTRDFGGVRAVDGVSLPSGGAP